MRAYKNWLAATTSMALIGCAAAAAPTSAKVAFEQERPQIEVAFVLDTTGSMSDLIEGAKRKIWSIANEILETEAQADVKFALIGFRDRSDDYVTQPFDLTPDINGVYGNLLQFQASGGGDRPESVNQALNEAVTQLNWSPDPATLRLVFLVGDSPPHMDYQDDVKYPRTLELAEQRDITINTVLAGGASDTGAIWREIARLGGGAFIEIPQSGGMQAYVTPYDDQIDQLQRKINDTVIPYGRLEEREYLAGQKDAAALAPSAVASDMAEFRYKAGKMNRVLTGGNDLVEDVDDGKIDVDEVTTEELPDELRDMPAEERKGYVDAKVAERASLNAEMSGLVKERDAWIEDETKRREEAGEGDSFDARVSEVVRSQGEAKGIIYKD